MKDLSRRAAIFLLAACASSAAFAERTVRGSGHGITEKRAVTGFDRVAIGGSFEVEIRQGTQEGVELTGDDNLLALIETRVEGRAGEATLRIAPQRDVQIDPSRPIHVRVDLIRVSGIDLGGGGNVAAKGLHAERLGVAIGGAGKVELPGLEAKRLAVSIGGSGRVAADGHAGELAISIGGSGSCSLSQLVVDDAKIDIAGSGKAEVNAARTLRVSIAGSGQVRHTGAAIPKVSIAGSGSVEGG